jgi:hypothetical protein
MADAGLIYLLTRGGKFGKCTGMLYPEFFHTKRGGVQEFPDYLNSLARFNYYEICLYIEFFSLSSIKLKITYKLSCIWRYLMTVETEAIRTIACLMVLSARTALKARGVDEIKTRIVSDIELK